MIKINRLFQQLLHRFSLKGGCTSQRDHVLLAQSLMASQVWREETALNKSEFSVYSQWGEDGLLQKILQLGNIRDEFFVEIGVEDYSEANTRLLLELNYWRGAVVDANRSKVDMLMRNPIVWRHSLGVINSFITRENCREVVDRACNGRRIGLLSIDIDGVDYFILEQLVSLRPSVIVCEYNAKLGSIATVSVPYEPTFSASCAHYSGQYFGASLAAFDYLLSPQGYTLVATCRAGANAFFVRNDSLGKLEPKTVTEAFHSAVFNTVRNSDGNLALEGSSPLKVALADLPILDVRTKRLMALKDIDNLPL